MTMILSTSNLSVCVRTDWKNLSNKYHPCNNYSELQSRPDIDKFVLFNGSVLRVDAKNIFIAFRAVYKNVNTTIDFPFVKYRGWYNRNNFIGIIHEINTDVGVRKNLFSFKGTGKKYEEIVHSIDKIKHVCLRKDREQIDELINENTDRQIDEIFSHFIYTDPGPEDPRLYLSNNKVILQYNMNNLYTPDSRKGGCEEIFVEDPQKYRINLGIFQCTSIFEVILYDNDDMGNMDEDKNSVIQSGEMEGKMLCANILLNNWTDPLNFDFPLRKTKDSNGFSPYTNPTVKNWSSSKDGHHHDVYNLHRYEFLSTPFNKEYCTVERYNSPNANLPYTTNDPSIMNLKTFFDKEYFTIAMTTPTVENDNGFKYGVAHIRINLKFIQNAYNRGIFSRHHNDRFFSLIKKNLECSDNSTGDIYLMCVYRTINFDTNNTFVSDPFIVTGELSYRNYSYVINFPCGIYFHNPIYMLITYGVGDCLLFSSSLDLRYVNFSQMKKSYRDIVVIEHTGPDVQFDRHTINRTLHKSGINFSGRFVKILFDLGGSGLKIRIFLPKTDKSDAEIIGYGPFHLSGTNYNIEKLFKPNLSENDTNVYIFKTSNGYVNFPLDYVIFGFSAANFEKLWTVENFEDLKKERLRMIGKQKFRVKKLEREISQKKFITVENSMKKLLRDEKNKLSEYISRPPFNPPKNVKLRQIMNFPRIETDDDNIYTNRKLCVEMPDIVAHFYSCCDFLHSTQNNGINGNILTISVGSCINIAIGMIDIQSSNIIHLPLIRDVKIVDDYCLTNELNLEGITLETLDKIFNRKMSVRDINKGDDEFVSIMDNIIRKYSEWSNTQPVRHVFVTGNRLNKLWEKDSTPIPHIDVRPSSVKILSVSTIKPISFDERLETIEDSKTYAKTIKYTKFDVTMLMSINIPFSGLNLKINHNMNNGVIDGHDY